MANDPSRTKLHNGHASFDSHGPARQNSQAAPDDQPHPPCDLVQEFDTELAREAARQERATAGMHRAAITGSAQPGGGKRSQAGKGSSGSSTTASRGGDQSERDREAGRMKGSSTMGGDGEAAERIKDRSQRK
ncbi:hypothetical protein [Chitinimonas naiadis]